MDPSRLRRSTRLSSNPQTQQQPSTFTLKPSSQPSSTSSSSYPSPTNSTNESLSPPFKSPFPPQLQPSYLSTSSLPQTNTMNAPMPSPSTSDLPQFPPYRPYSQPNPATSSSHHQGFFTPQDHPGDAGFARPPPAQQQLPPPHHHSSFSQPAAQGSPESALLADFRILEEAAKRAQMACLERDLGDVEL